MPEVYGLSGLVKLVILPRTREGLGRAGLRHHLETIHGPLVVANSDVSDHFVTYVHHYVQDFPTGCTVPTLEDCDAITVVRFAQRENLAASKTSAGYREIVGPDEDNFRDSEGSVALFAEELEVVAGLDSASRKLFIFRTQTAASPVAWADTLARLAPNAGALGIVTNRARVAEGTFPYVQFDEIDLAAGADPVELAKHVAAAAATQFGDCATACILTEAVRFI